MAIVGPALERIEIRLRDSAATWRLLPPAHAAVGARWNYLVNAGSDPQRWLLAATDGSWGELTRASAEDLFRLDAVARNSAYTRALSRMRNLESWMAAYLAAYRWQPNAYYLLRPVRKLGLERGDLLLCPYWAPDVDCERLDVDGEVIPLDRAGYEALRAAHYECHPFQHELFTDITPHCDHPYYPLPKLLERRVLWGLNARTFRPDIAAVRLNGYPDDAAEVDALLESL